jgi:hypothetical protein
LNTGGGGMAGWGGLYGGGGAGYAKCSTNIGGSGRDGAVRIVWPGSTRRFPSTCVGTP